MFWNKYKHIYITFGLTLMMMGGLWLINQEEQTYGPEITLVSTTSAHDFIIRPNTYIYEERYFKLCGEKNTNLVVDHNEFLGKTASEMLQSHYPHREGWQLDILKNDTIVFYRELDDYCSEHKEMRHLAIENGYIVIKYGPAGTEGGVARYTNILAETFPDDIKQKIKVGLLEFKTEDEALQALDALDEFINKQ